MITAKEIVKDLKEIADPVFHAGLSRFGINSEAALGIKIPVLRDYAKHLKKNHELALQLWDSKVHEARLLAIFIADHKQVTEELMEKWVKDFSSWDICDQACGLFDKTPFAFQKAVEWSKRKNEFEKRAGFAMMATLAVHDKKSNDKKFISFFPLLEKEAHDERNFVKKAINWALRQIGKRNLNLNNEAIACGERIKLQQSKSAKWIAADALRELNSEAVMGRLRAKLK
ncbi:MAG: DNA alkylation repair protein [Flavobacteriales bacterium]